MKFPIALFLSLTALTSIAGAHSGVLDQVAPRTAAMLLAEDPAYIWQQQVRVGVAGRLDAFEIAVRGTEDATLHVRLRVGDGWNVGPVVWAETIADVPTHWTELIFTVDDVGLDFQVGQTFVIEVQGAGTGLQVWSSYVDPVDGPALYPEELYLNGPGCYWDCNFRMSFRTWMLDDIGFNYCLLSPNSTGQAAVITASGSNSVAANDLAFEAGPAPAGQLGVFFYGPELDFTPAGNGVLCVGRGATGFARLPAVFADGTGTLSAALDNTLPPSLALTITPGSRWYFQAYFRDPAGGGSGINFSDALEITFQP